MWYLGFGSQFLEKAQFWLQQAVQRCYNLLSSWENERALIRVHMEGDENFSFT